MPGRRHREPARPRGLQVLEVRRANVRLAAKNALLRQGLRRSEVRQRALLTLVLDAQGQAARRCANIEARLAAVERRARQLRLRRRG